MRRRTSVRLGFNAYSIRVFNWKAGQLRDYAAAQQLDTIQISGVGDYESYEPACLQAQGPGGALHCEALRTPASAN
jgi:hypothetical protein